MKKEKKPIVIINKTMYTKAGKKGKNRALTIIYIVVITVKEKKRSIFSLFFFLSLSLSSSSFFLLEGSRSNNDE